MYRQMTNNYIGRAFVIPFFLYFFFFNSRNKIKHLIRFVCYQTLKMESWMSLVLHVSFQDAKKRQTETTGTR